MSIDLAGVFGAGLLTFLSPCVLPLVPVYLAVLLGGAGRGGKARLSLLLSTLLFSLGLSSVFVAMGLTASWVGALLVEHKAQLTLVGGLLVFLFGLKMLGTLRVEWLNHERRIDDSRLQTRFHHLNALVMGVVFSLGWTPCVGPILGSVLTYTASKAASPGIGGLYLALFSAGFVLPLLVLSLFADAARRLLDGLGRWLPRIEKASGALLAMVGLGLMLGVTGPALHSAASPAHVAPRPASPVASSLSPAPELGQPSERPRLVQFGSRDCPICRQMIPTIGLIERDCGGRKVEVIKVDVKDPEGRRLAAAYGVRGVPTYLFLDRSGGDVARLVGYQPLSSLRQALATLVGEQCAGVGLFRAAPPRPASPPAEPACSVQKSEGSASTTALTCGG